MCINEGIVKKKQEGKGMRGWQMMQCEEDERDCDKEAEK